MYIYIYMCSSYIYNVYIYSFILDDMEFVIFVDGCCLPIWMKKN